MPSTAGVMPVGGVAAHGEITGSVRIVNFQDQDLAVSTTAFAAKHLFQKNTFNSNHETTAIQHQTLTLYVDGDEEHCSEAACQTLTIGDSDFNVCFWWEGILQNCIPHIASGNYEPLQSGVTALSTWFGDANSYQSVAIWTCTTDAFKQNNHACPGQSPKDTWEIKGDLDFTYSELMFLNDLDQDLTFSWDDPSRPTVFLPDWASATTDGVLRVPAGTKSQVFGVKQITSGCHVYEDLQMKWPTGKGQIVNLFGGNLSENRCEVTVHQNTSLRSNFNTDKIVLVWSDAISSKNATPRVAIAVCAFDTWEQLKGVTCPGIPADQVAGYVISNY
eukprot:Clim_evm2s29 gene=Clim_evmTU2s29